MKPKQMPLVSCLTMLAWVLPAVAEAPEPAAPPRAELKETKRRIEGSAKEVIANLSKTVTPNPKVEPGKVKWHATMAEAQAAAEKSGKPVLLFQMMGKLDEQFC